MKPLFCFFEDQFLENFHPLTLTRPLYDLRLGILTLGEKWAHAVGSPDSAVQGILREHMKGVFNQIPNDGLNQPVLWLNPRFFPTKDLAAQVQNLSEGEVITNNDQLIAAHLSPDLHSKWVQSGIDFKDLQIKKVEVDRGSVIQNSWELFQYNGKEIESDLTLLDLKSTQNSDKYPHTYLINKERIYIEEGAIIEPGAMLLAEKGSIYIGKNAHIMANSVVRGPSAVCEKSVVKMGSKIYEETTIGPVCKVGGEISNVIFHSYSNKSHDGYTGNSVFGQWCNLGADTNTSNLKNNYSTVKVFDWKSKKVYDTGQQFIGTIMGDHSKTGINSMLNTGTICGVCCNLFSDGYPPKFVPSFSWVSGKDTVPYHFDKAIEAMERMMQRRSVPLTDEYHSMMKAIFQSTSF